ncbi:MAG: TonB-dependent receptor [Pseudomonadota bacterium]|nr:TonB-dependent receptor [Pseudomonadota bacterium]
MAGVDIKSRFDVPVEPLDKALRDFALQAHCNIAYEPSAVAGILAPAVNGDFTAADALSRLLAGTRLTVVKINEDTIRVIEKSGATSRDLSMPKGYATYGTGAVRIASAASDGPAATAGSTRSQSSYSADKDRDTGELQEITVTGSHIRGIKESASSLEIYTRKDVESTGAETVQQFLQTLPQNFNGGASENTIGQITGGGQANNSVSGSAPNLRGLGADATLVLINGHRVAPGNTDGGFVDVSMIPLTAVERIEMVTDGASAIYGSDAVGGVINFILRRAFDGAETSVQYGSVSTGSKHDVQIGQTVGTEWGRGSALLSYQYFDQTELSASSRAYLRGVQLPFSLLPEQVQHAAIANLEQEIVPGFDLHGDMTYSHRSTDFAITFSDPTYGNTTEVQPSQIDAYSASLGSTLKISRQSELAIAATYSESDTAQQFYQMPLASPLQYALKAKSAIISLDANVDGMLVSIPAGSVRYAVGAQYRRESFGSTYIFPLTDNTFYPSRQVKAGYIELRLPIMNVRGRSDPLVELTLADRGETYSDFGSTNNPQVGALWKPSASLTLRGTFGTSFKAPLLSQLNPVPSQVVPVPGALFNPAPGGTPNTLTVYGGNPNLKPEKATVWTAGLDFKPPQFTGFSANLTYYDIQFRDRITAAGGSICGCNAFVDEAMLGPEIVQRNPSAALIQQLISEPTYQNFFNIDPSTIGAIFDSRYLNLSTVKTRGLDYRLAYKRTLSDLRFETGIDGTYIFTFNNQFTNQAPETSIRNTIFNPTALRLRGRLMLMRGPLSTGLYLNFTNAYSNNAVAPEEHVASWATADVNANYELGSSGSPLAGVSVSFSVVNLAGRDPPYVAIPLSTYHLNYDGANANALGRYFSLRFNKRW